MTGGDLDLSAQGVAALAIALAAGAQAADKVKGCWVYTGPIGDFGYSYQHDQGRLHAAKQLGDKVDATTYVENAPDSDAERAIEQLAAAAATSSSPPRSASWIRRSRSRRNFST